MVQGARWETSLCYWSGAYVESVCTWGELYSGDSALGGECLIDCILNITFVLYIFQAFFISFIMTIGNIPDLDAPIMMKVNSTYRFTGIKEWPVNSQLCVCYCLTFHKEDNSITSGIQSHCYLNHTCFFPKFLSFFISLHFPPPWAFFTSSISNSSVK